ncbi:MAG: hypothetical protein ACPH2K_01970, partial [Flavicella sp.]
QRGGYLLLVGFGLNIALNANLFYKIYIGSLQINPYPYLFGVDFLLFAGLALFPLTLLKNKQILGLLIALVTASFLGTLLVTYTTTDTIANYILAFLYGTARWSYFPLLPWICYPLMGMLYRNLQVKKGWKLLQHSKTQHLILVLGSVFLFFTLDYAIEIASHLQNYYHHGISFVIWTGFFLMFLTSTAYQVELKLSGNRVVKYLKWLGGNVTVIYIVQWILIGNIGTEIFQTVESPLLLIYSYISVLAGSSCIVLVWKKIAA